MKVTVKESTLVKPMEETPSGSLWLSSLDITMPDNFHTRYVFFYRGDGAASDFFDAAVMKAALSRALVQFYPFAGRLRRDARGRIEINCNGEGVLFMEAECDGAVIDLGSFASKPNVCLVSTVDYSKAPFGISTFPLFLVQLTRFKCGGVSLGFANEHHLSDGTSGQHFNKSWGHLWRCLSAARGLPGDQETMLQLPVDARTRLRPNLPPGYLGNAIFYTDALSLCGELESEPLAFAVGKVRDAIARMDDEYLRSALDYMELHRDAMVSTAISIDCPNVGITSWLRLPFYEVDFGWGKPAFAGAGAATFEGKCYMYSDPENEGGIYIAITLSEKHMKRFAKRLYDECGMMSKI
ncbi:shikimate O-hydroxycinnamoyltransferase [Salvia divinorum]|uniref:Shikimate O-hydroxycinnamoyltransferase n=1 Tax=Salvia divinorum TaxID=28513 RepID=A0ABD1HAE9_SALDI